MRTTFAFIGILLTLFSSAQSCPVSRPKKADVLSMAALLGVHNIWSEEAFLDLDLDERFNKAVHLGKGVGLSGSLDMEGYLICSNMFKMAVERAGEMFGDSTVASCSVWSQDDANRLNDPGDMEKALRSGDSIYVVLDYDINDTQILVLSLICDQNSRHFVMAVLE